MLIPSCFKFLFIYCFIQFLGVECLIVNNAVENSRCCLLELLVIDRAKTFNNVFIFMFNQFIIVIDYQ